MPKRRKKQVQRKKKKRLQVPPQPDPEKRMEGMRWLTESRNLLKKKKRKRKGKVTMKSKKSEDSSKIVEQQPLGGTETGKLKSDVAKKKYETDLSAKEESSSERPSEHSESNGNGYEEGSESYSEERPGSEGGSPKEKLESNYDSPGSEDGSPKEQLESDYDSAKSDSPSESIFEESEKKHESPNIAHESDDFDISDQSKIGRKESERYSNSDNEIFQENVEPTGSEDGSPKEQLESDYGSPGSEDGSPKEQLQSDYGSPKSVSPSELIFEESEKKHESPNIAHESDGFEFADQSEMGRKDSERYSNSDIESFQENVESELEVDKSDFNDKDESKGQPNIDLKTRTKQSKLSHGSSKLRPDFEVRKQATINSSDDDISSPTGRKQSFTGRTDDKSVTSEDSGMPSVQRVKKLKTKEKKMFSSTDDNGNHTDETDSDEFVYFNVEGDLNFSLSAKEWNKMAPRPGDKKLRPGWSDIMAAHLKEIIPSCSIAFKHHYVTKQSSVNFKNYVSAKAHCKVTGCADFGVYIKRKPKGRHPVQVNVRIEKGQIRHPSKTKHKRPLKGEIRRKAQQEMTKKKPSELFYEKVATMNLDEASFGNLTDCQTRNVLKNAAHEYNLHNVVHQDPITEMIIIKHTLRESDLMSHQIKGYVQSTNLDPFSVSLYTEDQLRMTKEHFLRGNGVIYFDATGSIVRNRPDSKKRMFYYAAVVKGETGSPPIPIMEWVSENHTVPKISAAFMDFKYDLNKIGCKKNPTRIEVDFSWALIHSALGVFNEQNIGSYLETVYKLVAENETCSKFTIIHICAAHMIKSVRNALSKVTGEKRLAELLTRSFAFLQNATSIASMKHMWRLMLRVFLPAKKNVAAIEKLKEILSGAEESELPSDEIYPLDEFPDEKAKTIRKKSPFYKLFKEDMDAFQGMNDQFGNNNYRAVKAMNLFLNDYLPLAPLWSGLLMPFTNENITRDSNSPVENWFRIVKKDVMQGKTKLRIGQFISLLYKSLMGRIKARSFQLESQTEKSRKVSKNAAEENKMEASERWEKKTKKRKKKYFDKSSRIESPKVKGQKETTMYPMHGIKNMDNTCWLISSMQALAHQEILIETENVKDKLLKSINAVVKCLQKKERGSVDISKIRGIIERDPHMRLEFEIGLEQDAATFWGLLLQRISEQTESKRSILSLRYFKRCFVCDQTTEVSDKMNVLPLDVPSRGSPSVDSQFQRFFDREIFEGLCERCDAQSQVARWCRAVSQPVHLHLQLKRFEVEESGTAKKLNTRMFINRILSLNQALYMLSSIQMLCDYYKARFHTVTSCPRPLGLGEINWLHDASMQSRYQLHISTDNTLLIHKDGTIVSCDDNSTKVSSDAILQSPEIETSAYMLHYKRIYTENVFRFLGKCAPTTILRHHEEYPITKADIDCLKDKQWLNDMVVNHYLTLLVKHARKPAASLDSFFFSRLMLKKNVDEYFRARAPLQKELIIMPIFGRHHWSVVIADVHKRVLKLFDSTRIHEERTKTLQQYFTRITGQEWKFTTIKNLPEQSTGNDCGIHVLEICRCYLYQKKISITDDDVIQIRNRIVNELLSGRLLL